MLEKVLQLQLQVLEITLYIPMTADINGRLVEEAQKIQKAETRQKL